MKQTPTISYTIRIPAVAQQKLHQMAKAVGYQPTHFAQLLFEAAFAARCGIERGDEPLDRDLDEMVKAVFCLAGQFDPAAIATATGMPEGLVARILDAWREEAIRAGRPMAKAASKTGARRSGNGAARP